MSDKKIKKGFTIVELLIVIVVIGILSTIVIVTYQGVQDKANAVANLTSAKEVLGKAEAFNSLNTNYPTSNSVFSATDADSSVKLSTKTASNLGTTAPSATAKSAILYAPCPAASSAPTGAKVSYWDNDKKAIVVLTAGIGC